VVDARLIVGRPVVLVSATARRRLRYLHRSVSRDLALRSSRRARIKAVVRWGEP
jgi:hypothetical protein